MKDNKNFGVTFSYVLWWIATIIFFWTIIYLVLGILNIRWLNQIRKGSSENVTLCAVLTMIFLFPLGLIGGILMIV